MIPQLSLGPEEAQRAIAAVFDQAKKDGRPVAVAVVDNHGELIASARMDGAHARVLRHAIRKAYTAAVMGRDTLAFKKDIIDADRTTHRLWRLVFDYFAGWAGGSIRKPSGNDRDDRTLTS